MLRRGSPRAAAAEEVFGPLGTAVVTLPGYARDPRIASRDAGTGVSFDDDDRWAESPEEAITRVLVERLRHHGGDAVLLEPFPRGFEPAARVEIAFDRLLREPGWRRRRGRAHPAAVGRRPRARRRAAVPAFAGGRVDGPPPAFFARRLGDDRRARPARARPPARRRSGVSRVPPDQSRD